MLYWYKKYADSLLELDSALAEEEEAASQVLTLLALLVRKYKY
jgi:hypothetical protein